MRLHRGSAGNSPAFQAREIGEAALTDHDLIPSLPSNRRPKTRCTRVYRQLRLMGNLERDAERQWIIADAQCRT